MSVVRRHHLLVRYSRWLNVPILLGLLPITATGLRAAKLIKGARQQVVKDGLHCILWTHAEEVNAELLSFMREKAGESLKVGA